ncbi:MAG: hypothetical protein HYY09_03145 [Firmicutes bacterium]|nr:hypothetical protein [Bacillota bacterium]
MDVELNRAVMAVITREQRKTAGGAPIFHVESDEEMTRVAGNLARILDGIVHDLENGVWIVVRH